MKGKRRVVSTAVLALACPVMLLFIMIASAFLNDSGGMSSVGAFFRGLSFYSWLVAVPCLVTSIVLQVMKRDKPASVFALVAVAYPLFCFVMTLALI